MGIRSNLVYVLKVAIASSTDTSCLSSHALALYLYYYEISCMVPQFLALEESNGIHDLLHVLLVSLPLLGLVTFMMRHETILIPSSTSSPCLHSYLDKVEYCSCPYVTPQSISSM